MEMTLENLLSEGQLNHADFLARVDILGALGRTVLISKFGEYFRLAGYLARYTNKMIGLVMGVPSLMEIFDEKYYLNLEGGILEALGRMFKGGLKLYVYPMIDEKSGEILPATKLEVAPQFAVLFSYTCSTTTSSSRSPIFTPNICAFFRRMRWLNCSRATATGKQWFRRK